MARSPVSEHLPPVPPPIGRRRSNAGPRGAYADLLRRVHEIFGPLPVIDGAERAQIGSMRCVKGRIANTLQRERSVGSTRDVAGLRVTRRGLDFALMRKAKARGRVLDNADGERHPGSP